MDGQTEAGEARQHVLELLTPPIALVLVALDADRADGHLRLQQLLEQMLIGRAYVEVVDEQHRVGIALPRRLEHRLDQRGAAQLPADAGDGVVVLVEDRHDDHLVDHVPHVDHAPVGRHVPADARKLAPQDLVVGKLREPVRAYGVPAQRVALYPYAVFLQPFGRRHGLGKGRLPLDGLIPAPVKGQRAVVEQRQPLVHTLLQSGFFGLAAGFHHRHGVEGAAAEQKLMGDLIDADGEICGGRAVRFQKMQSGLRPAMLQLIHKGILLFCPE